MSWKAALVFLLAAPALAEAQGPPVNRPVRRLEVSFGGGLLGGSQLGEQAAELRANSTRPEPFRLFGTESRFESAPALEARAAFALTRRYGVEGGISFTRPELQSSISDDAEQAPDLVIIERIDQYLFDGGVFFALDELPLGPLLPVVSGGFGYLRQLHEGRMVVEEGLFAYGGFGVRHWLTTAGRGMVRATGIRADAKLYVVDGGIGVDDSLRPQGGVSASFFVVF